VLTIDRLVHPPALTIDVAHELLDEIIKIWMQESYPVKLTGGLLRAVNLKSAQLSKPLRNSGRV
jgi:hypothetical protein